MPDAAPEPKVGEGDLASAHGVDNVYGRVVVTISSQVPTRWIGGGEICEDYISKII